MQEDVENRAVALAIRGTKLTAHGLQTAVAKYLTHRKKQKAAQSSHGKADSQATDRAGTGRDQYRDHGWQHQIL